MKTLPYFRWYPADAETDENYSHLSDAELGFFHRCLNRSWINNGIPADLNELASVMRMSRKSLNKVWPKVSRCWEERDGRLFNKRQEEERSYANSKSDSASKAVRSRYERTTNALPRAYVSVSVSESENQKENSFVELPRLKKPQGPESWPADFEFEARFDARQAKHPIPGKPQIAKGYALDSVWSEFLPPQFDRAHDAWIAHWKTQNGGIPTLATFIFEKWYRKEPPAPAEREKPKSAMAKLKEKWGLNEEAADAS